VAYFASKKRKLWPPLWRMIVDDFMWHAKQPVDEKPLPFDVEMSCT